MRAAAVVNIPAVGHYAHIVTGAVRKRLLPLVEDIGAQWKGCYTARDAAIAARDLADLLAERGISGRIVTGHYRLDFWPDGPDGAPNEHTWIETEGLILDPLRRTIFGCDDVVLSIDAEEASRYAGERSEPF